MSEALADAEWVASWIGLCKDLNYDLRKRHLLNREIKIASLTTCHEHTEFDISTITDAKSLYDNLMQEQYTGAEQRAALEICVIRDSLDALGGNARWIPHDHNPADCLTKLKGNVEPLLKLLRDGSYQLVAEQDEMAQRKHYRETTGKKNPRPNHSIDVSKVQHTCLTVVNCMPTFFNCSFGSGSDTQVSTFTSPVSDALEMASSTSQKRVRFGNASASACQPGVSSSQAQYLREYEHDNKKFRVIRELDLDPDQIRYSQDSVYHKFHDGQSFKSLFNAIAKGNILPDQVQRIRVCQRTDGLYTAHDNRRLMVFKWLHEEGFLERIRVELVENNIPDWQNTTENDGISIRVRGRRERRPEAVERKYAESSQSSVQPAAPVLSSANVSSSSACQKEGMKAETQDTAEPTLGTMEVSSSSACKMEGTEVESEEPTALTLAQRSLGKGELPALERVDLPKEASEPIGLVVCVSRCDHEQTKLRMGESKHSIRAFSMQLETMINNEENQFLFMGNRVLTAAEGEKKIRMGKLENLLKGAIDEGRRHLNQLRSHQRHLKQLQEEEQDAVLNKDLKVPPRVYNFLRYLEARAIQRQRNVQHAHGQFLPKTWRQWNRKLYSNVRARIHNFLKSFQQRIDAANASITNEDIRCGQVIISGNAVFKLRKKGAAMERDVLAEESESQIARRLRRSLELNTGATSAGLKEPKTEKKRHARRGAEYKKRHNKRKKKNKRKAQGEVQETEPEEVQTGGAEASETPSASVCQPEGSQVFRAPIIADPNKVVMLERTREIVALGHRQETDGGNGQTLQF